MLLVNAASLVILYAIQRLQKFLPFNPNGFGAVSPDSSWNTAVSFTTNTNWQGYSGESTMSHFTQMVGLALPQLPVGGDRHRHRRGRDPRHRPREGARASATSGPTARARCSGSFCRSRFVAALFFVSRGVVQNFQADVAVTTVEGADAEDRPGPRRLAGGDQGAGDQRRRFLQRELRAPVREPDAGDQLRPGASHLRDRRGPDEHARPHDRIRPPRLGRLRRHGRPVSGGSCRSPPFPSSEATRSTRRRAWRRSVGGGQRRQHGRQGGPLRDRRLRALRDGDDRRLLRRGQLDARLLHADRRAGPARQHRVGRSHLRRRRRRPLRHVPLHRPLGLHRRPDGRPHARVPRQEDRGPRGQARDALGPRPDALHPGLHGGGFRASGGPRRPRTTQGPHGFSEILYAYTSAAGNNGSAFAGLSANTLFYNTTLGLAMFFGRYFMLIPILGNRRLARGQEEVPESAGTFPVTGPLFTVSARRRDPDRRRADVLSCLLARPHRRAVPDEGRDALLEETLLAQQRSRPLLDPAIVRPAMRRLLSQAPSAAAAEKPGHVRRLGRRDRSSPSCWCATSPWARTPSSTFRSRSGSGSRCSSPTSPRPWRRDAARRRPRRSGGAAPRPWLAACTKKGEETVPAHGLRKGDRVVVEAGERDSRRRHGRRRHRLGRRVGDHRRVGARSSGKPAATGRP